MLESGLGGIDVDFRVVASRLGTGRIRLTRMAAERGPILSGACGQVDGFQNVHARVLRVRAPTVSTGSSVSGV
jgi:hypothetical protein